MRERRGYRPASPPKERILEPGSVDRTTTFMAGVRSESVTVHPLDVEGLPSSATARTLSSADNGAASQRVAVPQGWGARFGAFSTTAEIFVLEGDLAVGDQRLRRYGYVRCPAGVGNHSDRGRRGGLRVPPLLERCARCRRGSIRARKPDGERVAGASVLRGAVPDDVVGDAPSEGGPLTGQGPPKSRAHALVCEGVVQLPPGAAGLCSHCYGVGVDLDDLIEPRHVQDDPAIGQGRVTEGVREAASSKLDGGAGLVGHTHHAGNPSSRAVRRCLRRPRRRDSGRCRNRRGPWPTRTRCACPGCPRRGPAGRCPSMPLARSGSGKPNGGL